MTETYDYVKDVDAAIAVVPTAVRKENVIVAPLTDSEAERGGLVKITGFMRSRPSKEALRKRSSRAQRANDYHERDFTIKTHDDDREIIRCAASRMIEDRSLAPVLHALLSNPELRSLISDVIKDPALYRAVISVWHNPQYAKIAQALSASPEVVASLRLLAEQPNLVALYRASRVSSRIRRSLANWLLGVRLD